jgi:hypothetical protein
MMEDYEAAIHQYHNENVNGYFCMKHWIACDNCINGLCEYRMPAWAAYKYGLTRREEP